MRLQVYFVQELLLHLLGDLPFALVERAVFVEQQGAVVLLLSQGDFALLRALLPDDWLLVALVPADY